MSASDIGPSFEPWRRRRWRYLGKHAFQYTNAVLLLNGRDVRVAVSVLEVQHWAAGGWKSVSRAVRGVRGRNGDTGSGCVKSVNSEMHR